MSDRLMGKSAYEILDVAADASQSELKRAYRRSMRNSHPDLGGDPEVFAMVQEAWAQVSSPRARDAHDRRRRSPGGADADERVWTTGKADRRGRSQTSSSGGGTRSGPARARASGHPGGWSRQQYLTLMREWVGRGVDLPDPYEPSLVQRAPREIRLRLADAVAEEATAKALGSLGSAFSLWHDVATTRTARRGRRAPGGGDGATGATKVDHVVLGPTGLFAIQSEDYDAAVTVGSRDLIIAGEPLRARPMKELADRVKAARGWGLRFSALMIVLPDEHLEADQTVVGRPRRSTRMVVRRSAVADVVRAGVPGQPGLDPDTLFDWRTRLQQAIVFV